MRVFLSYKVEDGNFVRGVAERLLANDLDIWFGEYAVLPEDYERFKESIDEGIEHATHAVVFSNDNWATSEWCQYEMKGLLAGLPGTENVLEVCIPKGGEAHKKWPELAGQAPIIFEGDYRQPTDADFDELVRKICSWLGVPLRYAAAPIMAGSRLHLKRFGADLDTGPFQPSLTRTTRLEMESPDARQGQRTLVFTGRIGDNDVSMDLYMSPTGSVVHQMAIEQNKRSDDRAVYEAYWKYAREWLREKSENSSYPLRSRGLHLVFVGGRSHMGLTYTSKPLSASECIWERRYAISLRDEAGNLEGEAGLVFAAALRGMEREQLTQFCRVSPQLEAIARSFSYRPPSGFATIRHNLPILMGKTVYTAAAFTLFVCLSFRGKNPALALLAAFSGGYFAATAINFLTRSIYRRLLLATQPISDDFASRSSFERLSSDSLHQLLSAPVFFLSDMMLDIGKIWKKPLRALLYTIVLLLCAWAVWTVESCGWSMVTAIALCASGSLAGGLFGTFSVSDYITAKREQ